MAELNPSAEITKATPSSTKPEDKNPLGAGLTEKTLDPAARELFENYCKIPPADVISHIVQFVRLISPPPLSLSHKPRR
jgi:hypothetical protein